MYHSNTALLFNSFEQRNKIHSTKEKIRHEIREPREKVHILILSVSKRDVVFRDIPRWLDVVISGHITVQSCIAVLCIKLKDLCWKGVKITGGIRPPPHPSGKNHHVDDIICLLNILFLLIVTFSDTMEAETHD